VTNLFQFPAARLVGELIDAAFTFAFSKRVCVLDQAPTPDAQYNAWRG